MRGTEGFLAALEQTQPLPRLTCPLTGSRLAASLMWAQGSCELPTAKPRMRGPNYPAPRRLNDRSAVLTEFETISLSPNGQITNRPDFRASSPLRWHLTAAHSSPRKWYRQRPLLTICAVFVIFLATSDLDKSRGTTSTAGSQDAVWRQQPLGNVTPTPTPVTFDEAKIAAILRSCAKINARK